MGTSGTLDCHGSSLAVQHGPSVELELQDQVVGPGCIGFQNEQTLSSKTLHSAAQARDPLGKAVSNG